jgi:tetratricopeptide (TPR) repeat protein
MARDYMSPFSHTPLEAITLYRKGMEQWNKGKYEPALKFLSYAVMLAPQFTVALCEMGRCYEKLGRYPEALSKFEKVLEINQAHTEADLSRKRVLEKMQHPK